MQKANEKSNPSEQEPAEERGRVSSVKAQNRGTTHLPQDSLLGANSASLMSALDREQLTFEMDNPHLGSPEDMANFAAYLKRLKAKKAASSNPTEPSPLPLEEQSPDL